MRAIPTRTTGTDRLTGDALDARFQPQTTVNGLANVTLTFTHDNWNVAQTVTVAAINIHHFVVDAYIWRLRRDPNYANVVDAPVPVAV